MNRRVWITLWSIGMALTLTLTGKPTPAAATGEAKLAEQAQSAFNDSHYADAVKLYEQLARQVPGDPGVLYNLGTTLAHAGQPGLAIWRYLQALRLNPRDAHLRANLELLAPGIFQQLAIAPIPPINWIYQRLTTNEWTAVAGTAAVLAMLTGAIYLLRLHRTRHANTWRSIVLTLLIFSAVAYPFAFTHYHFEDQVWRGVVVVENTVAHAGPGPSQTETDRLPVGTVLNILESTPSGWLKFSYAGGRMGFVQQDRVRSL